MVIASLINRLGKMDDRVLASSDPIQRSVQGAYAPIPQDSNFYVDSPDV